MNNIQTPSFDFQKRRLRVHVEYKWFMVNARLLHQHIVWYKMNKCQTSEITFFFIHCKYYYPISIWKIMQSPLFFNWIEQVHVNWIEYNILFFPRTLFLLRTTLSSPVSLPFLQIPLPNVNNTQTFSVPEIAIIFHDTYHRRNRFDVFLSRNRSNRLRQFKQQQIMEKMKQ